jgi:hypothetical protein
MFLSIRIIYKKNTLKQSFKAKESNNPRARVIRDFKKIPRATLPPCRCAAPRHPTQIMNGLSA